MPTRIWISPDVPARRACAARSAPLSRPVSISSRTPAVSASGRRPSRCCRARISVGAIIAPCPPASTAISSARNATSVLPAPTSPCSRRFIRAARAHVGGDLGHRARPARRSGRRAGAQHLALQVTVPRRRPARAAAAAGAGQRQRQLVREELVIGEPLPGGIVRRRGRPAPPGRGARCNAARQPGQPSRCHRLRVDPLGQLGRQRQRAGGRLPHRLLRQPAGQRIDRLEQRDVVGLVAAAGYGRDGPSGPDRRTARPCPRRRGAPRRAAGGAASRRGHGRRPAESWSRVFAR